MAGEVFVGLSGRSCTFTNSFLARSSRHRMVSFVRLRKDGLSDGLLFDGLSYDAAAELVLLDRSEHIADGL